MSVTGGKQALASSFIGLRASQLIMMWRSPGEQLRQFAQVNAVTLLERRLTNGVLLDMVITTEAD